MIQNPKLGAQLFTLRNFLKTYEDTAETFRFLSEIGIRVIQISGIGPIPQEQVAELVTRYNMEVCGTHIDYNRLRDDTDTVIAEHRLINCNCIGIGSMPMLYQFTQEGLDTFLQEVGVIGKKLKAASMQFTYHNHAFELRQYDGRRILDILMEDTEPDDLHFVLDTYWLQYGGVNPVEYIHKAAGRMEICHFKDYQFTDDGPNFTEIGTGNLNLDACYRACRETGVEYIVIEQDICEMGEKESMALSYKNLCEIAARNA